ncbi:MAG TPA: 4-(cytidine 5'-diphospho)-2-C-methyl-D-erythritol kinase [Gemmatimonadales bacterium]
MTDRVRIQAHAKVNLLLRVLAKEVSGFHAIETLFSLLELADELVVERTASGINLRVEGADTGPAEENLVWGAARLVLDATGNRFGVRAHLTKRIPVKAGLGGGSSDGAAALMAVNRLAGDAVPRNEILQLAARLGSDVPFFASGAPLALAWGRGERLFRIAPPKPAPVLLAVPTVGFSTKTTYHQLDDSRSADYQRGAVVLDPEVFTTWGGIGRLAGNDFESVVFATTPALKTLFERMAATRPLVVRMTGSGSALLAVYRSEGDRDAAAMEVGERDCRLIRTVTRARGPEGPAAA